MIEKELRGYERKNSIVTYRNRSVTEIHKSMKQSELCGYERNFVIVTKIKTLDGRKRSKKIEA